MSASGLDAVGEARAGRGVRDEPRFLLQILREVVHEPGCGPPGVEEPAEGRAGHRVRGDPAHRAGEERLPVRVDPAKERHELRAGIGAAVHIEPAEGLLGQGLAAYAGEEAEEVRNASGEHQIGAGRLFASDGLAGGIRLPGWRRIACGRRREGRLLLARLRSRRALVPRQPPQGHDAERAVPHLGFEHAVRAPHHEREAPPLALAEERREVGVGGRPEGGDPTADPVEQEVHRGAHRQPRCTATTPALRLKYRHRRNPAARIISSRASWSGCMRIDSAR